MGPLLISSLTISAESAGEECLKIGQHLPKLWAIKSGVLFSEHGVYPRPLPYGEDVLPASAEASNGPNAHNISKAHYTSKKIFAVL